MQKIFIALLLIIIAPWSATYAQTHYSSKFAIGGKAGITLSKMSFSPGVKQSMIMGKTAGVSIKYWEEKNFGLIAELNFEQRGWKENFEEYPFAFERQLDYIQLPLLTHIFFGNNKIKGFVNLGPEIGYMIGHRASANFDYNDISNIDDFPTNRMTEQMTLEPTNKFDYGISGGAGVEFILKRKHMFNLEARYYFGIGNIFPDDRRDTFSASRGMSILITLGYSYRLK